jgi:hypothetical protein
MYALEIINALNDPDNPAKPKGLSGKLARCPKCSCTELHHAEVPAKTAADKRTGSLIEIQRDEEVERLTKGK